MIYEDQKEDVTYAMIPNLWRGDDDQRTRLCSYCITDAELSQRLVNYMKIFYLNLAMAVVCAGIPVKDVYVRGQQIKVLGIMMRQNHLKGSHYIFPGTTHYNYNDMKPDEDDDPVGDKKEGVGYKGAFVLEPDIGFKKGPILVFDFTSLYPSIMKAHNLSHEMQLFKKDLGNFSKDDYHKICPDPVDKPKKFVYFKKKPLGLLPATLEYLLQERKKVKKQMKQYKDSNKMYFILDGKQLALKVNANSGYGATGATNSTIFNIDISASTTGKGRDFILLVVKILLEASYSGKISEDLKFLLKDAKCVGGDTDSVFFYFPNISTVELAQKYGDEISDYINLHFPSDVQMKYEQCYMPMLILGKKRYVALIDGDINKKQYKGIEIIRRDALPFTQRVATKVLDMVLNSQDVEGIIKYIKEECHHLHI